MQSIRLTKMMVSVFGTFILAAFALVGGNFISRGSLAPTKTVASETPTPIPTPTIYNFTCE